MSKLKDCSKPVGPLFSYILPTFFIGVVRPIPPSYPKIFILLFVLRGPKSLQVIPKYIYRLFYFTQRFHMGRLIQKRKLDGGSSSRGKKSKSRPGDAEISEASGCEENYHASQSRQRRWSELGTYTAEEFRSREAFTHTAKVSYPPFSEVVSNGG